MDAANQPNTGRNDLPPNPIIQEQPPMYMSLEQIRAIPDATVRGMAEAAFSMQAEVASLKQVAFDEAKHAGGSGGSRTWCGR